MDKPTDLSNSMASSDDGVGQAKIDTNNKNDATSSSLVGNSSSSSCNVGCGPTSSGLKLGNTSTAGTTLQQARGPPSSLPNVASNSITSTLQQRIVSTSSSSAAAASSSSSSTTATTSTSTQQPINLNIKTTTGGNFDVRVDPNISVEHLKKVIAKQLKVSKDRICLLHRERELRDGLLKENSLMDGSKIILIPNVETGLLAQRPENTVMQALESLNDSQVNDFLSGKTPLNLSMRLGDHMMLIQLQLSTVNPANGSGGTSGTAANGTTNGNSTRGRSTNQRTTRSGSISSNSSNGTAGHHTHHHHHHHHHHRQQQQQGNNTLSASSSTSSLSSNSSSSSSGRISLGSSTSASTSTTSLGSTQSAQSGTSPKLTPSLIKSSDLSSFISKRDYVSLQNIVRNLAKGPYPFQSSTTSNSNQNNQTSIRAVNTKSVPTTTTTTAAASSCSSNNTASSESNILEQSPIKSLSNLVTSSTVDLKNIPNSNATDNTTTATTPLSNGVQTVTPIINCQDPIAAKLTSCLCTRLNIKNCVPETCGMRAVPAQQRKTSSTINLNNNNNSASSSSSAASSAAATALLHKTANNPIVRSKHRHHHHHHHHHHYQQQQNGAGGSSNLLSSTAASTAAANSTEIVRQKLLNIARSFPSTQTSNATPNTTSTVSNDSGVGSDDLMLGNGASSSATAAVAAATPTTTAASTNNASHTQSTTAASHVMDIDDSGVIVTDTRTLAEASRNLTQTLRKLSKEVFTNKIDLANRDESLRKSGSGAVFDSMKNHGKGIYSGTFSGTLNPALQDRYGRPKRDISTVIHILNDLLSVTPQYGRGARFSIETPTSSNVSAANVNSSHSKHLAGKHHGLLHNQNCLKCVKAHANNSNTNNNSNANNSSNNNASNSSNNNANCAYGECNGHYPSGSSSSSNNIKSVSSRTATHYACCTNNHSHHHHHHHHNVDSSNERNVCSCRYRTIADSETGEREREHTCQKCLSEMENLRTKSKLDQLRLVMQQRKQKREARKLNSAPYEARAGNAAAAAATSTSSINVLVGGEGGDSCSSTEMNEPTRIIAGGAGKSTLNNNNNNISNNNNNNNNSSISSNSSNTLTTTTTTASSSEVPPNHIVEEVDTAA